jgi:hypothetical protein
MKDVGATARQLVGGFYHFIVEITLHIKIHSPSVFCGGKIFQRLGEDTGVLRARPIGIAIATSTEKHSKGGA